MTEETNMNVDGVSENINKDTYIGRVKWFNRRNGFGFINVVTPDNDLTNEDVFFHFSQIKTENYKIVYPGEYVSFNLSVNESDTENRNICVDITGIYGGPLLVDNEKYSIRVSEKRDNVSQ